ncbi:MAG TPA: C40 family peptidase [Sporichthyaceae bacterium]|nr:C40 family peptidase [Sporichthyaceae bacterium]
MVGATLAVSLLVSGASNATSTVDVGQAQREVDALYQQAEQATERYDVARNAMLDAERALGQAQSRAAAAQGAVGQLQKTVGAFAASAYRNGGLDQTLQLVFSEDPATFLDRMASLDALSTREADQLRKVVSARQELAAGQAAAAQQLAVVALQRRTLAAEKAQIEQKLQQAQTFLSRLKATDRARLSRVSRDFDPRQLLSSLPLPTNAQAAKVVQFVLAHLGDRYVWAASGMHSWDCSGLAMMAWRAGGVSLPHSSTEQFVATRKVSRTDLQPGDLVFFYRPISHVGIYIGNGYMVHAPNPGRRVEVAPIDRMPFAGASRP